MQELETDVVVIGGGVGGTSAALHAEAHGLRTLLISKGLVGKSGASIFGGNLIVGGRILGGTEENAKANQAWGLRNFNHYLVDQDYVQSMAEWADEVFWRELDEAGLYLRRDEDGDIVTSKSPARIMCAKQQGQSSVLLMDLRRKQIFQRNVDVLEESMVTKLLTDDEGRVVGVTVLNYLTGQLYAVAAKAVIMATGHADRFATRATATREQSADGLAMAWEAGAELENLEIQWWHASDVASPASWQRLHIYPNPLVGSTETARLYNARGEMFFEQKTSAPNALAPYVAQTKALIQQVQKGNARFDGGYYTSYAHIDGETIKSYNNHSKAWPALGLDVTKDKMETAISWHFRQGGINVDPHSMETSVPGLYVAGAIGGHYNGGIQVCSYDGKVVADTVAERVPSMPPASLPRESVRSEELRIEAARRTVENDGIVPAVIKKHLREVMWDKMGLVKNERKMNSALDEVIRIRHEMLPRMGLQTTTRQFNYSWVDSLDIESLLTAAELQIRSGLLRTESRGPFYREDYPYTDNDNWTAKNIVWKTNDGSLGHRTEAYKTPYLQPEPGRVPYFDIDW